VIELTSSDRVAHDARVRRVQSGFPITPVRNASNRLKRQARVPVLFRIEFEQGEYFRCQPAGANLVTRESRPSATMTFQPCW
jgi:hypothetical protein